MTNSVLGTDLLKHIEGLFMKYGIKSLTMDDVAADLGISKKTLYQWFSSKDELVFKVLSHHISREKSQCHQLASTASNAIEEILILMDLNSQEMSQMKTNVVYDLQKYHREAWEMLRKYQQDFVFKIVKQNIERGREEGFYREDFDIDIITKLHLNTVFNLFDPELFPESPTARVNLFKEYMLYFLHGIISNKGLAYLKKKLN
ncbi:MAG TPA: TetR/AcrR family transcriptional regulator [Saprospiraceae bacterium]|nr:TetR/AcrR family transcriptional regulator [Saprospiraceae bacterium]